MGRGAAPAERRLLVWPLANDMRIKFVGFSALWGDKADFRWVFINKTLGQRLAYSNLMMTKRLSFGRSNSPFEQYFYEHKTKLFVDANNLSKVNFF